MIDSSRPVLVFGAGGQVGQELVRQSSAEQFPVVGLKRAEADICDRSAVAGAVDRYRPAAVVNAAAYTAVDKAEGDERRAFAVNAEGAGNLARAAAAFGAPLIHISTDYVFDGRKDGPYRESDPVAPLGAYGRSKEAGERAVRAETPQHVILRTAWIYASHGHNFVRTMLRLAAERDIVRVVSDQHGTPTSAADLAQAIHRVIQRCLEDGAAFGTFHATNSGHTTWHGLAARIFCKLSARGGRAPRLEAIPTATYPTPAQRPGNSVLDCSHLKQTYGIVLRPWEAALDETLDQMLTGMAERSGM